MRWLCAVGICVLSWPLSMDAQDLGTFKGIIFNLGKDQTAPTGFITLVSAAGKHQKFIVNEFTTWETVQGKTVKPSNFLAEHRGQKAEAFVMAGTNPPLASKVQIFLPMPQHGPGIKVTAPNPNQLHGIVGPIDKNLFVLYVGHGNPPPVVAGTVMKAERKPGNNFGKIQIQVTIPNATWPEKSTPTFIVNQFTNFQKMAPNGAQPWDFLGEVNDQLVVIIPRWGDPSLAAGVQLIMPGTDVYTVMYNDVHHGYQTVPLQYVPGKTQFDFVRDGKSTKKDFNYNILVQNEWVNVDLDPNDKSTATAIHVLQPGTVKGQIAALGNNTVSVVVHHIGGKDLPTHDTVGTFHLNNASKIIAKQGNKTFPLTAAALQVGEKVEILTDAVRPHPIDSLTITFAPSKAFTAEGTLTNLVNNTLVIQLKNGSPKGTPNAVGLSAQTQIKVTQKGKSINGNLSSFKPGQHVIAHGNTGPPCLATKVEIKLP